MLNPGAPPRWQDRDRFADGRWVWVGKVEGATVEAVLVHQMVDRASCEIDRDQVDLAAGDAIVGSHAGRRSEARLSHLKIRYGPSILSIAPVLESPTTIARR